MHEYQQIREQAAIDPESLDNEMYVAAGTEVTLYDEDETVLAATSYDEQQWTTIGDAVLDSLDDEEIDATALDQAETVYLGMEAPGDSIAGIDSSGLDEHIRILEEGSPYSQDAMEHEYLEGVCDDCGSDMDFMVADPEKEDLDVYMYNCDDCGNTGHYFGGQESEDGAVTVQARITSTEAVESTGVDIRDNASFTAFDLDMYEKQLETERVAVTDTGQLDARVLAPEGSTIAVYAVDADHDVESVHDDEIIYETEIDEQTQTTIDAVLTDAMAVSPEVGDYIDQLGDGRSITIDLEAPATAPNGFSQERFEHSKYMDPVETATFVENQSMRRLDGNIEALLTHVLHDYGQEWKDSDTLKHMKGGRPPIVPDSTEKTVKQHLDDPNFGLVIEDQTGGSDIEEPDNGTYTKVIDESVLQFEHQE